MADTQFDWADPLRLDALLTDEERMVRESARRFCDEQLMPRVRDDFRAALKAHIELVAG